MEEYMVAKIKRKIVCRYCGYHMDAGKSRCPFCGTYVNPEPVSGDNYSLFQKNSTASNTIYITERYHFPVWNIVKKVAFVIILFMGIAAGVYGGKYLYQKYLAAEIDINNGDPVNVGVVTIASGKTIAERMFPSLDAEIIGNAESDESYTVYEIAETDGHIWYRIGDNSWILDDEILVNYVPKGEISDGK